jgi:zinc transport system permease protein
MSDTSFWQSSFVWRDAIIVSSIAAAVLAYLGVWVALKRVVYVPLALSQVSSVGVILAFWICGLFNLHDTPTLLDPAWTSILFASATALLFARPREQGDNVTVVAYLVCAAGTLLLGTFVRQDVHDVQGILFGSAVLVETVQITYVGVAAIAVAVVHLLCYRQFLFVSFDRDTAGVAGFAVYRYEVLLYVTFAVMISVATRAIGALPAFGFTVLPALAGLRWASSMRQAFLSAIIIGVLSASVGYYLSFIWELPTGPTMVGLAGVIYLASHLRPAGRAGRAG